MTAPLARAPAPSWRELLGAQAQVLSRRQARLGGLSDASWESRRTSGRWQAPLPGVAVAHSGELTDEQRAWAAVLYAGAGAALSSDAALKQHGMTMADLPVIHVAVPEHRRVGDQVFRRTVLGVCEPALPPRPGPVSGRATTFPGRTTVGPEADDRVRLRAHRVRQLRTLLHPSKQPPVMAIAPAVLHAAAWAATDRAAEWRVAAAVQQRLVRPADLMSQLAVLPRLPRRALLRAVLEDVRLGAHAASELDFLRFLRTYGLPRPDRLQLPVRRGSLRYLDAWWERQRVTAELDGAHHQQVGTWGADALRANEVQIGARENRVMLLRFTTGNLRHDADRVAAQLRDALL